MAAGDVVAKPDVLVVEDSWQIASAIKSMIESAGMRVSGPAATLADAGRQLAASRPDMAVVDMNLHGDLATGLVQQLLDRNVPVVIVTGYEVLPALADRADAVLRKPIRASALLAVLRGIWAKLPGA